MEQLKGLVTRGGVGRRLRLLRYGLIAVVIVTFFLALLAPVFSLQGLGNEAPPLTDFLGDALLKTAVVALFALVLYFGYRELLKRTVGLEDGEQKKQDE